MYGLFFDRVICWGNVVFFMGIVMGIVDFRCCNFGNLLLVPWLIRLYVLLDKECSGLQTKFACSTKATFSDVF